MTFKVRGISSNGGMQYHGDIRVLPPLHHRPLLDLRANKCSARLLRPPRPNSRRTAGFRGYADPSNQVMRLQIFKICLYICVCVDLPRY